MTKLITFRTPCACVRGNYHSPRPRACRPQRLVRESNQTVVYIVTTAVWTALYMQCILRALFFKSRFEFCRVPSYIIACPLLL